MSVIITSMMACFAVPVEGPWPHPGMGLEALVWSIAFAKGTVSDSGIGIGGGPPRGPHGLGGAGGKTSWCVALPPAAAEVRRTL